MKGKGKFDQHDPSIFLFATIGVLLAGGIVAAAFTLRTDPVSDLVSEGRIISVLYVIEKENQPLSTFVLMSNQETRKAAIFDIPSNVGMLIRQINRVDSISTMYDPSDIASYKSLAQDLLGVEIAFSIVITLEDLGKAVDLLEGVELFIASEVSILDGESPVLFPSAVTRLDGDKAVSFLTYSIAEEDGEAAMLRRQRFFLSFLRRQRELNNELKNPAIAKMYQSFMRTSLSRKSRLRLFDELATIDFDGAIVQFIGGSQRTVSGKALLIPLHDGNQAKDTVRQVLGTLTSPADGFLVDSFLTVEVLNGTAVNGLAGRTAEMLRGLGYDIISVDNADTLDYEKTLIIDRSGDEEQVMRLAKLIRCDNIRFETPAEDSPEEGILLQDLEYNSGITLIIGKDFNGRYVTKN
jgi:anionic cell wall polymer biosynthesis LytR-Cps2A-Psr (LCP) family protein